MNLENLPKRKNRVTKGKRVGRGYGSARGGHTAGRGTKGQLSRSGHKSMVMFEGGNVPFFRRIPKFRGFKKADKGDRQDINVHVLDSVFDNGATVNVETLRDAGLIKKSTSKVKILGMGELSKKLTIEGLELSESAREKVLAAKGKIAE